MTEPKTVDELSEEWWSEDGKYIDPDTSDVGWFDKRGELAMLAFIKGYRIGRDSLTKQITSLAAERDQAVQERDKILAVINEETQLLDGCGVILCRNQVNHEMFEGCLYCERDALKAQLKESQEFVKTLRADVQRLNSEDVSF
jgi:uncharacterized coiled-coil DUF342 family protein